jgi:hypothetical protein
MISEKHSQSARINGARSRGPVTPEGKAISSRNAMRHGLLARNVLLSNEDPKAFEMFFYLFIERFKPVNDIEMSMIEDMTAAQWRLHRGIAMEKSILESGIAARPGKSPIEQITGAWCDPMNQVSLTRLERYQTRLQNMYQRALRGLQLMRKIPVNPDPPPEPAPVAPVPNEPSGPSVCNTEGTPQALPAPPAPSAGAGPEPLKPVQRNIVPFVPPISS